MLSWGLAALSGSASGFGVEPAGSLPDDAALASSEAELSGTGEAWTGGLTGPASATAGAGELTEVSPVNGFLYSLCGVMTSSAVGL
jgi:hypothetical protein